MNQPFFSIIIPVYNAQDYLTRCLDSCIHQTFQNIEIILIDDCGEDQSMQIAQRFAQTDSRIKILHNPKNLGTFHTRIRGMEEAVRKKSLGGGGNDQSILESGYVLFVDSDDYLDLNACEILYQSLKHQTLDIVVFNISGCSWDPIIHQVPQSQEKSLEKLYGASICARVYSKSIIRQSLQAIKEYFPPLSQIPNLVLHEDALICFIFLYFCKRYKIITDLLYFYCENPQSVTRQKNLDNPQILKKFQMRQKIQISKLFRHFESFPQIHNDFHFFKTKTLKMYRQHILLLHLSTQKSFVSQYKYFVLSNQVSPSIRNYLRFALYVLSFGLLKNPPKWAKRIKKMIKTIKK